MVASLTSMPRSEEMDAIPAVEKLVDTLEGDEKTGANIVAKALAEPMKQIAANAGIDGSAAYPSLPPMAKARSLRRSAFPHRTRSAGLRWEPRWPRPWPSP